jgi:dTMP kinase
MNSLSEDISHRAGGGRFITIEGGEGTGKSTLAAFIADVLRECSLEAIVTREPGGSEGADQIRQLLVTGAEDRWDALSETLLLQAARRDHVIRTIAPALESGMIVICDRFLDSTIAYQGYGHGIDLAFLNSINNIVTNGLRPDLTLILDAPAQLGITRALNRLGSETRYELLHFDFHERARRGFLEIAEREPTRCRVFDATQPLEKIKEHAIGELESKLDISLRPEGDLFAPPQRSRA